MIFSQFLLPHQTRNLLPFSFFQEADVVLRAQELLGKVLVSKVNGIETAGIIIETEAYRGEDDKASHAFQNKRTPRTETMFLEGGHAYVYLCYGLHHLFNVVVGPKDMANAVLIRGIEPVLGLEEMLRRRNLARLQPKVSSGPACLSQAFGINKDLNKSALWQMDTIWLEDWNLDLEKENILATTRIGVSYAGEDAFRPWRFLVKKNPYVSAYPKGLESA